MKENKFKVNFNDGSYGVYGLKMSRKEIRNLYYKGKRMCIGEKCDGISMINVYKKIVDIVFVTKQEIINGEYIWS